MKQRIQKTIDYMEAHLQDDISIWDIAGEAYYSIYHYQRLFKAYTGHSVMDYLRKRRLAHAAFDMLKYGRRMIDVAFDYGYRHEQAFLRAFKVEFGICPGLLRKEKRSIFVTAKKKITGGSLPYAWAEPRLVLNAGQKFIGTRKYYTRLENLPDPIVFRIKREFINKIFSKVRNGRDLHLFSFDMPEADRKKACFFPCLKFGESGRLSKDLDVMEVPPHFSFSLPINASKPPFTLNMDDMKSPYDYIFNKFIPATEYEPQTGFSYTVINLSRLNKRSTRFSINVPVK